MAIKFSKVKLTANEKSKEFLMGGVPLNKTDLNGWVEYENFLKGIGENEKIQLNAQIYVYGEGDKVNAEPEEVAYIMQQIEKRPNFLQDRCKNTGSVNFNFDLSGENEVTDIKELYPKGTRIILVQMYDDESPIEMGTKGTVDSVDSAGNVHMVLDNGRTLALCPDVDRFLKIDGIKVKEEDEVVEIDDEVYAVVPRQAVDCSRLGYFDDLEEDSWNLIKQYCAALGIKILPNSDGEIPISYTMAKEVQDKILELLKETGLEIQFEDAQEQEEIKMGVMQ